jgi:hypothetical protein
MKSQTRWICMWWTSKALQRQRDRIIRASAWRLIGRFRGSNAGRHTPLICDKSVTTQNLAFLSYWCRKESLQMHRYSVITQSAKLPAGEQLCRRCTKQKTLPKKSHILSCDTVVANERFVSLDCFKTAYSFLLSLSHGLHIHSYKYVL